MNCLMLADIMKKYFYINFIDPIKQYLKILSIIFFVGNDAKKILNKYLTKKGEKSLFLIFK
jgi:hypothetical protein